LLPTHILVGLVQACHWEAHNKYIGLDFQSAGQALQDLEDRHLIPRRRHQFHFHIRPQIQISSFIQICLCPITTLFILVFPQLVH